MSGCHAALRLGSVAFVLVTFACSSTSTNSSPSSGGSQSSGGGSGAGATGGSGGAVAGGCADGTDDQLYAPDMVGCDGQNDQCTAQSLCASGWHLCTYGEYALRGGKTVAPTGSRWLRSCVRDYSQVDATTCPSTQTCTPCSTTTNPAKPTTWDCNGAVLEQLQGTAMGVMADDDGLLRKPGCDKVECTYSKVIESNNQFGATCCK